jgi:hypothetical protein
VTTQLGFARLALAGLVVCVATTVMSGQSLSYLRGQNISPAFEGWEENPDGSFNMLFGYMNRNWEEEVDVPVGPENNISPGPADQGQPTHFQPRRNRFVFRVRVPKDWGEKELVWTLTTKGKTEHAYATLRLDSRTDNLVQASENGALGIGVSTPAIRANIAPDLTMDTGERRAQIGQPLTLVAIAKDDGVPRPRFGPDSPAADRAERQAIAQGKPAPPKRARGEMYHDPATQRPPTAITVDSQTGLRHSCFVYRGAGRVNFSPRQHKTWEDTRAGANSPWAPRWFAPAVPADGKYVVNVSFEDPGTYTIRCMASDGALNTYRDVVVNVTK